MSQAAWLRLLAAATKGARGWVTALRSAGSVDALLGMSQSNLASAGLGSDAIAQLHKSRPPEGWSEWLAADGHDLVTLESDRYPESLRQIADPPLALWARGSGMALLTDPQLAVVGSRNPTRGGALTATDFARELSRSGLTITSGLALGIDAAGHRGAIQGPGGTIAVLGAGIDGIYPHRNRRLADEISRSGLIVSEYGPGVPARPWQFPRRNRIIAGLTLGTLVVEATRRSGSLITGRLAAEFGREVFAVPGSIHNTLSKGCHKLIRDGAKLVECAADILIEIAPQLLGIAAESSKSGDPAPVPGLPPELRDCLAFAPVSFDTLLRDTGLTAAELSSMLLHLEFQGKIEALPGGRYCRIAKRS